MGLVDMEKLKAHCFCRGGIQLGFVAGMSQWPLDVVTWWSGCGDGNIVNTIICYLPEITLKYEKNYTHCTYTLGSDKRLFNTCVTMFG